MKCRYCNIALAPLRSLTDGEFCCDDHRHAYNEEQAAGHELSCQPPPLGGLLPWLAKLPKCWPSKAARPLGKPESREFHPGVEKPAASGMRRRASGPAWAPPACDRMLPLQFSATPQDIGGSTALEFPANVEFSGQANLPPCSLDPIGIHIEPELEGDAEATPAHEVPLSFEAEPEPAEETGGLRPPYRDVANSWRWLCEAWRNAPKDLKVVTILLPVLLALGLGPVASRIKLRVAAPSSVTNKLPALGTGGLQQSVAKQWNTLHETILNRAAVEFTDDFRSGLDAWVSRSNLTTSWSYDASGFVQPGPLAVFKPTEGMTDYRFQFLGEIDQKALGCAFRATDLDNYYALKLAVVKPGPLPLVRLVRYAVINGREGRHVEKPLPINARPDTLYRMVVDVRGSDFTIMAQGQVVDFWSDSGLARGGVGFFCGRGEKARIRWVEVSHQYDALGRLCAYLAPYGLGGRNGNWN